MSTRTIEYMKLADIERAVVNAKGHDAKGIKSSVKRFGVIEVITMDERTLRLVSGHGRLDELQRAEAKKEKVPDGIEVDADGEWTAPVVRGWRSKNDDEAIAAGIAINQLTIAGGWNITDLSAQLAELQQRPSGLSGTGFNRADLDAMLARIEADGMTKDAAKGHFRERRLPSVDLIFTAGYRSEGKIVGPGAIGNCCLAVRAGWTYGTNSKYAACRLAEHWKMHHPMFVDNEYHDYDHARHVEVVSHWHPKYATVKDVMTEEQCIAAGIDFAPFEQIIEWADELREHADNVILIPKYPEAIEQIPEHFMLGYSIPTSHGGTPIPTERFKGRKVHLLGGTPLTQLNYWHKLADDVVSIDNNSLILTSRMGMVYDEHGDHHKLSTMVSNLSITNAYYCALVISLGNVASWYGLKVEDIDVAEGQLPDRDGGESHD